MPMIIQYLLFTKDFNFLKTVLEAESFNLISWFKENLMNTLVDVYVDLVVFTRIVGTSKTGSGRYWC